MTELPTEVSLADAYPNPFNPVTTIRYGVPESMHVRLVVYDILGREIISLVDNEQSAGYYEVTLDATNFPTGQYLYRLTAGTEAILRTVILIK